MPIASKSLCLCEAGDAAACADPATGPRRSRYRGLAKTALQHQLTGAATDLIRVDAHPTDTPRARTRHFAALRPAK
ncbi:hypothetical protein AB0O07_18115 [Streptomyces sp. NPDC093085]|uniref:hypothetical protein n=1 Tax=Streptomyces sp. NPDC093085 TaxID=3155068 RepID=UPI00341DDE08